MGNVLRTILHLNTPKDLTQVRDIIGNAWVTAMHSIQINITTALQNSQGALVYVRDILLNIPLIGDWLTIQRKQELLVSKMRTVH